jgi:hypothetical protein
METAMGVIIIVSILASAHFSQKSCQELKKLNNNIEDLIKSLKAK